MIEDDFVDHGQNLITQFKSMDKVSDQLRFILVQLYSLDEKTQEYFIEEIMSFEKILMDQNLMRMIKHRDSLIGEYPTEYYGRDYGGNDPFKYKAKLETKITQISMDIMGVLGKIIEVTKPAPLELGDEV